MGMGIGSLRFGLVDRYLSLEKVIFPVAIFINHIFIQA